MASQIADEAVKRGHAAIMFSMEVDDVDIYMRDVERHAGKSRWDLLPHVRAERRDAAQKALTESLAFLVGQPGKVVYSEPMSVEGIRQAVLTENLRYGKVEVVIVDHAQVALPSSDDKRSMPRYLEVKNTAEGLREIARKPGMEQVRESKDINHCSEVVMVIEHQKETVGDDIQVVQSYIHIDKARAGSGGRVPVVYRGEVFRFEDEYEEPRRDF